MNKLKKYRLQANLTQRQLAVRVGVQRETIGRIEQDKHIPSVRLALLIAAALDVTVEAIWKSEKEEVSAACGDGSTH